MNGSDNEDGQCNRSRESNIVMMGDVLTKKHTGDSAPCNGCIDAESDLTRHDNDRLVNYVEDVVRSPIVADSVPVAVCFPLTNTVYVYLATIVHLEHVLLAERDTR